MCLLGSKIILGCSFFFYVQIIRTTEISRTIFSFCCFKKSFYQLLEKECAYSTGKLFLGGFPRTCVVRITECALHDKGALNTAKTTEINPSLPQRMETLGLVNTVTDL